MKQAGIYKITNKVTGQCYIGSAVVVPRRLNYHRARLSAGKHPNHYLQSAWAKHGRDNFSFALILVCAPEQLLFYEQLITDAFRQNMKVYNLAPVAGNQLGFRHSEEAKARMRALKVGKRLSPEHRAKISAALKGHAVSDRHRAATSARFRGRPLSAAHRAKLSAAKRDAATTRQYGGAP